MRKPFIAENECLCVVTCPLRKLHKCWSSRKKKVKFVSACKIQLFLTGLSWFSVIRVSPQCFHSERWKLGHSNRVMCVYELVTPQWLCHPIKAGMKWGDPPTSQCGISWLCCQFGRVHQLAADGSCCTVYTNQNGICSGNYSVALPVVSP